MDDDTTRKQTFEQALKAIEREEPLSTEQHDALSALNEADVAAFRESWRKLPAAARERLVRALWSAADKRLRLEYSRINYLALDDEDASVRLAGVESSLEDRSDHLLKRLLQMVVADPSPAVRRAATEELARFALLGELDGLHSHDTARVRQALLGRVRDTGEDRAVRSSALAALGYFSDEEMAEALGDGFSDPELRQGAVRGMGRSADPRWTDRLMPVLGSEDPRMRLEAARALGEIEDERAVGPLSDLVDDPERDVRVAVIAALGQIGGDEAREALLYVLEDPDPAVREAAEKALTDMEDEEEDL